MEVKEERDRRARRNEKGFVEGYGGFRLEELQNRNNVVLHHLHACIPPGFVYPNKPAEFPRTAP